MNSVILHFDIPKEEVINIASLVGINNGDCASESGDSFLFWDYEEYESEYGEDEKQVIKSILGRKPVSSFQLLCRLAYGHFALQKVTELFSISSGVLDDDNGGYWKLRDLESAYNASNEATIYNVSNFKS
jgi:hypothetical protein